MTIIKLIDRDLIPDTEKYQELFTLLNFGKEYESILSNTQPRLYYALKQTLSSWISYPFMLLKAPEEIDYLNLIADTMKQIKNNTNTVYGGQYSIEDGGNIVWKAAVSADSVFAVTGTIITIQWAEAEQLFGCLRQFNGQLTLHPGLVHQANGGALVISLRSLISQPILWMRLKSIATHQRFDWISWDISSPIPVSIPSMPIFLKIVLIGDRESLATFRKIEPELGEQAIYSEFEDDIYITDANDMVRWCQWVLFIAKRYELPIPSDDAWHFIIREAVRYTGDQETLPLSPLWIVRQLREVSIICHAKTFNGVQFTQMLFQRKWRENHLVERMRNEILHKQILVETEGERIGQINALSVIEFPGYPGKFGEPLRISCVVHIGDGEFIDIERKSELGGNIHAKSMMIIRAFLMSQLHLKHQIPFSASITFEQSYYDVDGDSASIAELCALISALANVPINQNIAVTGSIDQFGRVQPVSDLNEKIEGFFYICQQRNLNGKQGVIIPAANTRHLSLCQNVLDAVEANLFNVWSVECITDVLPLLTNLLWDGEDQTTLIQIVHKRIDKAHRHDTCHCYPWPLNWLRWFRNH